ncbi:hypothetical protein PG989_016396 [Apiospora arundinis]
MYQHFIPQFLLKNFAHHYKEPNNTTKRHRKIKHKKGKPYPGDLVVNHVNLTTDPPELAESLVKRVMGQFDMYRDTTQPSHLQQHVEQLLGKIESRASTIFRSITKAFERGDSEIWINRDERNLLRKFLFLLKYRGSTFHRRFYHVDMQTYSEDDASFLRDYMEENGIKRPLDVWFSNIKTIIELQMDPDGNWRKGLVDRMYPDDATWFIMHVESMYMAICTPPPGSTHEFVVTDNCYNIFEGPINIARDTKTGSIKETLFANLHEFAPITPKLLFILRSNLFPCPEEDADPNVRRDREETRREVLDKEFGVRAIPDSLLANLPIYKARTSYAETTGGRVRLREGEDGKHRRHDKFRFDFIPISGQDVHDINGIFLDNTRLSTTIVFASRSSFFDTLEIFLTSPSAKGKVVTGEDGDSRLKALEKLSALGRTLGSNKEPLWTHITVESTIDYEMFLELHKANRKWSREFAATKPEDYSPEVRTYVNLGGIPPITLLEDMKQSRLMLELRIKLDSWSNGVDEHIRQRNRELLVAAYLRCPPRRIFFYVKAVRTMALMHLEACVKNNIDENLLGPALNGVEDVIANASVLFEGDREGLNRLMYKAVLNEIDLKKYPNLDLWAGAEPTFESLFQWPRREKIVFGIPGNICDCGIPAIALLALMVKGELVLASSGNAPYIRSGITTAEHDMELRIRMKVRDQFDEALERTLEKPTLQAFKKVFFETAFPTPPLGSQLARLRMDASCIPLVTCHSRRPPAHNSPIGAHQFAFFFASSISPVPAPALRFISWPLPMVFAAEGAQPKIYSDQLLP